MKSFAIALMLATSPPTTEDLENAGRQAVANEDHRAAATAFDELARRQSDVDEAIAWTIAATAAWQRDHEQSGAGESLCAAIDLLQHFASKHEQAPPDLEEYWSLVEQSQKQDKRCGRAQTPAEETSLLEASPEVNHRVQAKHVVAAPSPRTGIETDAPEPATKKSKYRIAGSVLTGASGVGIGMLIGQSVSYARTIDKYWGEDSSELYQRARRQETGMIVTGVATGAALVTGVVLLAVHKRLVVRPSVSGVVVLGRF